jgi:hypothetical protein
VTPNSSALDFTWTGDPVSQVLGNSRYTVTAKSIGVPIVLLGGVTTPGRLTATVTVAPAQVIPEPSTLTLTGLGSLGLLGLALCRRRVAA